MKRPYFCFNFCKKKNKNKALFENLKFEKGCLEPFEHILYLKLLPALNHGTIRYY